MTQNNPSQWMPFGADKFKPYESRYLQLVASKPKLQIPADMFESVNKKTLIHPLYKVGSSIVKGLPEEARLNSDG
jgi:hypothetical protein